VSTHCLLSPAIRAAVRSVMNKTTTRTPFRPRLLPWAASGGYPQRPGTSAQVSHTDLRRCVARTRDAYDRFLPLLLQSRAPVPRSLSVRSRLARTESCRFRPCRPPWRSCLPSVGRSSTQRFHAAEVAPGDGTRLLCLPNRPGVAPVAPPSHCRPRGSLLRSPHPGWRLDRFVARTVKTSPLYVLTRLPSRGAFRRPMSRDTCRVRLGAWATPHDLAWLLWFCRQRASRYAPSPRRFRAAFGKPGCLG